MQCASNKCTLCSAKFGALNTIQSHYADTCPKYLIRCEICKQTLKRDKFLNHQKCDKALAAQHEQAYLPKTPIDTKKIEKEGLLLNPNPPKQPAKVEDVKTHWRKKTKKCYLCGLGRWCRVCK
jgi:hypothetical protein